MDVERISFSLLVPSYNRPELIRETILSLLANSAADVEIIVADDASPKQAEIRAALAEWIEAGQVKWIGHTTNLGWSGNRNSLVQAARGEFVILLGDDDRLKLGAIDRLRFWQKLRPDQSIFGFGYDLIDAEGIRITGYRSPRHFVYSIKGTASWKELFYYDTLPQLTHHPFTIAIKRTLLLADPYDSRAGIGDDAYFLFKTLQRHNDLFIIPEILFEWRKVDQPVRGYINLSSDSKKLEEARIRIWLLLLQDPLTTAPVGQLVRTRAFIARFLWCGGTVARHLERVVQKNPLDETLIRETLRHDPPYRRLPFFRRGWQLVRALGALGGGFISLRLRWYLDRCEYRSLTGQIQTAVSSNTEPQGRTCS
jgi:glycosyltransferase involved in cell wall biosynthesis